NAAAVPQRRQRIPAERKIMPAAGYPGIVHGHGVGAGIVCAHRARTNWADPEQPSNGSAGDYRRSRWGNEVQDEEAAGGSAAGRGAAELVARERYFRGSHAADEFAQAAGFQGGTLRASAR